MMYTCHVYQKKIVVYLILQKKPLSSTDYAYAKKLKNCQKLFNLICFAGYFKTTLSSSISKVLNNFEKKNSTY